MSRKINGFEEDILLTGGLLAGGYLLLRHALPDLFGKGASPEDKQTLDQQQTTDATANIFSYQSQDYADWFNQTMLDYYPQFGVDTDSALYQVAYRAYRDGNLGTDNPLYEIFQIYDPLTVALLGHLLTGDQDGINTALNMITDKWQVGAVSAAFININGIDFWNALRNGSFPMMYGLNPTDLAAQVRRLNSLPD